MFKKVLLCILFLSVSLLQGSKVGKKTSLTKASWPLALGRIVSEMNKYDKNVLYQILREAEKKKGAKATYSFLFEYVQRIMHPEDELVERIDFFGIAIINTLLGLIKKGIALREAGEDEEAKFHFEMIKELQEDIFNFLQSAVNDGSFSPRGSSDEITPRKKKEGEKKGPSSLSKEVFFE